ncbi:hypothetical protein [Altererythrobacter sp. C41]|uniref:hypothetical protein n=1 Tax=Altererythrobacter sp. C41 TaxID=2806021 RepID=UPI001932560F|nr:hypothetical protein [Altererythrobacter sp. C41]MBM0170923.1 hypothetical protein [Altererythrobacter sp. C41]
MQSGASLDSLRPPPSRGLIEGEGAPLSDAALDARLAEYGVALRPPAGDKPWPGGWLPGDPPILIDTGDTGDAADPYAASRVFDTERRVRFLDALATCGEVRAAAARVGVSRETCYRARRRDPDFKRLWDAALVHARAQAEAELATRALHGIEVPVFVRGEHVATWRRHDARLLLAHLGRLDRRVEDDHAATARAERFDELLAGLAGHAPPADLAEDLAGAARERDPADTAAQVGLPPTRAEILAHARDRLLDKFALEDWDAWDADEGAADEDEAGEGGAGEDDADTLAAAEAEVAARYDAWQAQGMARLDAILAGTQGGGDANDESPRRRGPQAAGAPPEDAPAPADRAARDPRLRGGSEEVEEASQAAPESPRRRGPQAAGAPPEDAPAPADQAARDPRLRGGSEEVEEASSRPRVPA